MAQINAEICETSTRGMFITLIGGIYDPKTQMVRIANAGHEPPLHQLPDNTFLQFEAESPPIGITTLAVPEGGYDEVEISLDDGPLYIFTDGATEGSLADGTMLEVAGVKKLLTENRDQPLEFRLNSIVNAINRGDGPLHDDITILGLDANASIEATLTFSFTAQPSELKSTRNRLRSWLANSGIDAKLAQDIVLIVDESCQNIIRHAYGGQSNQLIDLTIIRQAEKILIYLRDYAARINVENIKPREIEDIRPGGLGVHFISEIMDEVHYLEPESGSGNLMKMIKNLS